MAPQEHPLVDVHIFGGSVCFTENIPQIPGTLSTKQSFILFSISLSTLTPESMPGAWNMGWRSTTHQSLKQICEAVRSWRLTPLLMAWERKWCGCEFYLAVSHDQAPPNKTKPGFSDTISNQFHC